MQENVNMYIIQFSLQKYYSYGIYNNFILCLIFKSSLYISLMVIPFKLTDNVAWVRTPGFSNEEYPGLEFRGADFPSTLLCRWWCAPVMVTIPAWELPFEKHQPHSGWNCPGVDIFILFQGRNLAPAILSMDHSVFPFLFFQDCNPHCWFSCFPVHKGIMTGYDKRVWMVWIKIWTLF